jgi:inorganic pyrophosphatase
MSCKFSEKESYTNGIGLRIEIPMGAIEEKEESDKGLNLPYIYNKAVIPNLNDEDLEFLIVSEALEKNDFLQTYPIAVLRLKLDDKLKNIVISMPSDAKIGSFRINNFLEFVSEYYFLKQNIENWYLNKNGLGSAMFLSWEDEKFALGLINRKLKKKG